MNEWHLLALVIFGFIYGLLLLAELALRGYCAWQNHRVRGARQRLDRAFGHAATSVTGVRTPVTLVA